MSIFKSTLTPTVSSQLKARESIISQTSRDQNFLIYTTGKNSFVRLRSFVNYTSYRIDKNAKSKLSEDSRWTGDNLSKKWVLEGGTLYNKPGSSDYSLRGGVGSENSVYASNLDFNNEGNTSNVGSGLGADRMYGLRPMPGITSVEVMNKSAYGSLREATINFFCWDRHQLEELELLYMRPGYSCYLEWGWSQYLHHDIAGVNQSPSNIKIKNFEGNTLDVWRTDLTDDIVYATIDAAVETHRGNYDAMLGYVKNYSWQLMPNGGFQCSTTLISRGEVMDTLKASSNPNIVIGSEATVGIDINSEESKPIYSNFEKIFLNIVAHINDLEFWEKISNIKRSTESPGQFFSVTDATKRYNLISEADKVFNEINQRLLAGEYKAFSGTWQNPKLVKFSASNDKEKFDLTTNLAVKLVDGGTEEGMGVEYISMNAFIAILTEYFIFKNKKDNKPAVNIAIPNITPCLASEDSVSIDPTACIIYNPKASFITGNPKGFSPQLYSEISMGGSNSPSNKSYYFSSGANFLQDGTTNIGTVGNIYVSISKILQIYRNLSGGPDGVDVIRLLQEILDACSFALGGINDFKLYNDKSTVQIIDAKYFETEKASSKFKFDLIGLKSICRDVKINSRIFAEQSTMIAIGATSGQNNANLGDIYTSTQNYFNWGLSDRILKATYTNENADNNFTVNGHVYSGSDAYYFNLYSKVENLGSYLAINVLGLDRDGDGYFVTKLPQSNQVVNAGSLLKTFHYQINGKDTNFKSLIPFELEITLDGIGGFVVGQIFTIDKSILPRDYYNKNLGFIITGINHSLQNNDWVTNIKTQICLLENDQIEGLYQVNKDDLKKKLEEIRKEAQKSALLVVALADYMVHETVHKLLMERGDFLGYSCTTSRGLKAKILDGIGTSIAAFNHVPFYFLNGGKADLEKMVGDGVHWPENHRIDVNVETLSNCGLAQGSTNTGRDNSMFVRYAAQVDNYTGDIEQYLKNWHSIHLANNTGNPDFPQTYNEFITSNGDVFNSTTFSDFLITKKSSVYNITHDGTGTYNEDGKDEPAYASELKNAWDGLFIGRAIEEQGGTPFIVPADPIKTTNTYPTVKYQSVRYDINTNTKTVKEFISAIKKEYNSDYLTLDYTDIETAYVYKERAFDAMFKYYWDFIVKRNSELGLSKFLPLTGIGTFDPYKWNLENIIK